MSSSNPGSEPRRCHSCGAPLQECQDWCISCGAAAERSSPRRPGWRSAAAALSASTALALGAAAAAYAAFNQRSGEPNGNPATVAQTSAPATPGATTTPVPSTATTPSSTAITPPPSSSTPSPPPAGNPTQPPEPVLPEVPQRPPSVPPGPSGGEGPVNGGKGKASEPEGQSGKSASSPQPGGGEGKEEPEGAEPEGARTPGGAQTKISGTPMLLDTNAAKLYRPAAPQTATSQPIASQTSSELGDPGLAIDGVEKTSWTVKVDPETAPKVDVGATFDMRTLSRVSQLLLITSTPGTTIQVYGTRLKKPPASLASKDWTKLTGMHLLSRRRSIVDLRYSKHRQFRQLLIWIVKAPSSSTKQAPGQVSINEVTLYEPA